MKLNQIVINKFGIIRFLVLISLLIIMWLIVLYVFITYKFTIYETFMIITLPIVCTILLFIGILCILIAHPIYIVINNNNVDFVFLFGLIHNNIPFEDIKEIKVNYKLKLNYYPLYITRKSQDNSIGIFGIGKNIQKAIIRYAIKNKIPIDDIKPYTYLPKKGKNGIILYNNNRILSLLFFLIISILIILFSITIIIINYLSEHYNQFILLFLISLVIFTPYFLRLIIKKQMQNSCLGVSLNKNFISFTKPLIGNLIIDKKEIKEIKIISNSSLKIITTKNNFHDIIKLDKKIINAIKKEL